MPKTKCGFNDIPDGTSGSNLLALYGPTLIVDIGFDKDYNPRPNQTPKPGITNIQALVDTGATESCIDNLLASELNLPITDRRSIAGAHGRYPVNMYLAQIHIPSLNYTIYGAFAGVALLEGGQVHKAIIGRSFLQHFTMIYEGRTGTVTLSSD